jgi:predicted transcriptional regulator
VPVAPIVGVRAGDDDLVALAGTDLVIAARTPVRLDGFVGLDVAHVELTGIFDVVGPVVVGHVRRLRARQEKNAQANSTRTTTTAAPTNT